MATLLDNTVLDAALNKIKDDTTVLHICNAAPTSYGSVATYTIGSKSTPTISVPADRTGGGREITIAAFTDGIVSSNDTANAWALVSGSVLLVAGDVNPPKAVATGSPFELAEFTIGALDPA